MLVLSRRCCFQFVRTTNISQDVTHTVWVFSGAFSHTFTHILFAHHLFAPFNNRSHGQRGADVETLRGTSGANYEGEAKVKRGGSNNGFCGCFGGSSDGEPVSLV